HIERQARRDSVRVDLVRVQAFRLDEDLVRSLVGEAMNLVFDRGTVARADAFDHAREHRRAIAPRADDLVRPLVRRGDVADDLARMVAAAAEVREHRDGFVAGLDDQPFVIDRSAIDAWRRAGLQAPDTERQGAKLLRETIRWRIPGPSALVVRETDVDLSAQARADRQHDGPGSKLDAGLRHDATDRIAIEKQIRDFLLKERQVRLILEDRADGLFIECPIGLRASRTNGGPFARVQRTELDAGKI